MSNQVKHRVPAFLVHKCIAARVESDRHRECSERNLSLDPQFHGFLRQPCDENWVLILSSGRKESMAALRERKGCIRMRHTRSYSRIVISGCEPAVVQIAVLRVASGNPWLARPPNPAEPRLADARRWAALAAHGLNRLAAASQHLAGTSGYLWIGGAVGIRSLNAPMERANPDREETRLGFHPERHETGHWHLSVLGAPQNIGIGTGENGVETEFRRAPNAYTAAARRVPGQNSEIGFRYFSSRIYRGCLRASRALDVMH
ncbi:hypothetical protein C8R44DRAFT_743138 [Mycena epipterygia]|nr:hypothetical protein C8R44DRAFT_743138 [Mycena epipterygia]